MRTLGALVLVFGLFACGGGAKPAPASPEEETTEATDPVEEEATPTEPDGDACCCEQYDSESEAGSTWEWSTPEECDALAGTCQDDTSFCPE